MFSDLGRAAIAAFDGHTEARRNSDLLDYYRERAMGDQREDLYETGKFRAFDPGSVVPVKGPAGVFIHDDGAIQEIASTSPEQIIRSCLRMAMQRHDYAGIASLATSLHEITSESE